MRKKIEELFNKSAATYDDNSTKTNSLKEALFLCVRGILSDMPEDAHILCVGAGTGQEVFYLALAFPKWKFTIVEPASAMLDICKEKAIEQGIASRCTFHQGYLETLPKSAPFHAATSIMVSQFLTDERDRIGFFQEIADRLAKGGLLINADLTGDMTDKNFKNHFRIWRNMHNISPEKAENLREQWQKHVALVPAQEVEEIISSSGFEKPTLFYQASFAHAWFTIKF